MSQAPLIRIFWGMLGAFTFSMIALLLIALIISLTDHALEITTAISRDGKLAFSEFMVVTCFLLLIGSLVAGFIVYGFLNIESKSKTWFSVFVVLIFSIFLYFGLKKNRNLDRVRYEIRFASNCPLEEVYSIDEYNGFSGTTYSQDELARSLSQEFTFSSEMDVLDTGEVTIFYKSGEMAFTFDVKELQKSGWSDWRKPDSIPHSTTEFKESCLGRKTQIRFLIIKEH
ncbi:hypothetical protein SCOR_02475 [Sulfidibacter corallicola]|uniref:Uncharacterized protein n=1 Tax=Sulfidibacter corallicola TaxID=2818388 RepID=A0A8A4TIE3_SULCO|nr:hypothetical protein [Sulfidibacter corallicola]QTD48611.1 hypothetical protein J3U87_23775 [Sulfidibacter corallicola]